MFEFKRKLHAKLGLWLFVLFVCLQRSCAQNASTVVWEPSNGTNSNDNNNLNTNNKRDVSNNNRLDYGSASIAKSYDPPPEFYRGPGSTSSGSSTSISHPVSNKYLGSAVGGGAQLGSVGESLSEAYNKWRQGVGQHDRISVGHFGGGAGGGVATHIQSPHGGQASYAYEGHPYEYSTGGGAAHGSYYGGGSSAETGLPFDVYGARPGHGLHHVHYSGNSGEYAYPEPHDIAAHKGPPELSQKALLAKSFLIPLASAAVLGIAAALVSNPLLLQLGTVSGIGSGFAPVVGKRKRRALRRAYPAHK
ncbi:uncharacterized protein LOC6562104 [Drosophila grimshawi]|uniref:GH23645 n=1 Tax=Drosophila grimshawi TaxID=7222 RepID=B4K0C7_DROGR|nr:uncharacterized protein LOC6562104 [Drosophila grimshawi]EDV93977.1 GH23645 [Drosophila grimshawi]